MISIIIPCYEMYGKGGEYLKRSLDILERQVYKDFEVVIPDNSDDDVIEHIANHSPLKINYFKNPRKGMAANTNEGIKAAKGEIIKILYQDDYFKTTESLRIIVDNFKKSTNWLATGCLHLVGREEINPHYPVFNHEMFNGNNMIGSPSVTAFRNDNPILMDETLQWVLDLDLYIKMYNRYGIPDYLYDLNVVIGLGKHQTTNALTEQVKSKEIEIIKLNNE